MTVPRGFCDLSHLLIMTSSTPTTAPVIDCERLLLEGVANIDYVQEAQNRGLCSAEQPLANIAPPPTQNAVSGAGSLPLVLIVLGLGAAVTMGLDRASRHGAKRRHQGVSPASLPGGYVGQPQIRPTNTGAEYGLYTGIQPIQTYSYSDLSQSYTGASEVTEPSPWAATTVETATRGDDRTASDMTMASCWAYLKKCTVAQFQEKIGAGDFDPIAVQDGQGKVAAKNQCFEWFSHDINETGKVGWAVFGCDGQGGAARAKATAALVKDFRTEYHAIA
jgi:hypothetical protein